MKLIRFTLVFLLASVLFVSLDSFSSSCKKRRKKKKTTVTALYTVSGIVTETHSYCGGARPSPEIVERMREALPLSGATIVARTGTVNGEKIVATAVTDSLGHFKFELPPGTYCIVGGDKVSTLVVPANTQFETWDKNCLEENWKKCDLNISVTDKNIDTLRINYHRTCPWSKPCLTYKGPLPG